MQKEEIPLALPMHAECLPLSMPAGPFQPIIKPSFLTMGTVADFKEKWQLTNNEISYAIGAQTENGFLCPSEVTVSRWVTGERAPSPGTLSLLSVINTEWTIACWKMDRLRDKQGGLDSVHKRDKYLHPYKYLFWHKVIYDFLEGKLKGIL